MSEAKLGEVARLWLREVMDKDSLSLTDVKARTGVGQSTTSRLLEGKITVPRRDTLSRLRHISDTPLPATIRSYLEERPSGIEHVVNTPGQSAGRGIPVWGVIPVAPTGVAFRLNPYAAAHLGRADLMKSNPKLIAFYSYDDSMAPRWQAGEPVVVDLLRSGRLNEPALIEYTSENPDEPELRMFRIPVSRRNGVWVFENFEGQSTTLLAQQVLGTRHVLDWRELSA